jgi:hypothetical protein
MVKLLKDFPARSLFAKEQSRHGDGDDQKRRDGKDRIVGEGGAKSQRPIFRPFCAGRLEQRPP